MTMFSDLAAYIRSASLSQILVLLLVAAAVLSSLFWYLKQFGIWPRRGGAHAPTPRAAKVPSTPLEAYDMFIDASFFMGIQGNQAQFLSLATIRKESDGCYSFCTKMVDLTPQMMPGQHFMKLYLRYNPATNGTSVVKMRAFDRMGRFLMENCNVALAPQNDPRMCDFFKSMHRMSFLVKRFPKALRSAMEKKTGLSGAREAFRERYRTEVCERVS